MAPQSAASQSCCEWLRQARKSLCFLLEGGKNPKSCLIRRKISPAKGHRAGDLFCLPSTTINTN